MSAVINAVALPALGIVRITLDFTGGLTWGTWAGVERVDAATGEATPVRPHTDYDGWLQMLSGDRAVLYDTEAPLDTPFYYRATNPFFPGVEFFTTATTDPVDTFTRTVAAGGWGTSTNGYVWSNPDGNASAFSVDGAAGVTALDVVNTAYVAVMNKTLGRHYLLRGAVTTPVVPTGGDIDLELMYRTDATNYYIYRVTLRPTTPEVRMTRVLNGTFTTVSAPLPGTIAAGTKYNVVAMRDGPYHRMKAWRTTDTPPEGWVLEMVDDTHTTGQPGVRHVLTTGNSNTKPVNVLTDDIYFFDTDPANAQTLTLDSGGGFWLRSPLKPYKNRPMRLQPEPGCPPGGGIFFANMDTESYAPNGGALAPVNRRLATGVTRPRRGVTSTMTLVTRTFTDRDDVLDLLSDGTPLQYAGPPEYGIPAQYMLVGEVSVARGLSDHRFQPRLLSLPYTRSSQPAGPPAGVTGARHRDLCRGSGSAASPMLQDTFDRDVSGGWGWPYPINPDTQQWTWANGSASDYSVIAANSAGRTVVSGTNSSRRVRKEVLKRNLGIKLAFKIDAVPAGGSAEMSALTRISPASESDTFFQGRIEITTAGAIIPALVRRLAGSTSMLATGASVGTYTAGTVVWVRYEQFHDRLRMKAWTGSEPATWQAFAIDVTGDNALPTGHFGLRTILYPGNTNGTVNFDFLHYEAYDLGEYGPAEDWATWDGVAALGYSYNDMITVG